MNQKALTLLLSVVALTAVVYFTQSQKPVGIRAQYEAWKSEFRPVSRITSE